MAWWNRRKRTKYNVEDGVQGFQRTQPKAVSPRKIQPIPPVRAQQKYPLPDPNNPIAQRLDEITAMYDAYQGMPELVGGENIPLFPDAPTNSTPQRPTRPQQETEQEPEVESVRDRLARGEHPMFMSSQEILSTYQSLDADRDFRRLASTLEEEEEIFFTKKINEAEERWPNGRPKYADDEDYQYWPKDEYPSPKELRAMRDADSLPSLYSDIKKNGIQNPISLQESLRRTGNMGRPEILGGHHRLAIIRTIDPTQPIPVAFFEDIYYARDILGDNY